MTASGAKMSKVPVIDLSQSDEETAVELVTAFQTVGFATLVSHGVDSKTINAAFKASKSFFELSEDQKMQYKYLGHKENCGYSPFQSENHEGNKLRPDKKETYDIGTQSEKGWTTPWPKELSEFEEALLKYYGAFGGVYKRLIKLVALGLGLDDMAYLADRSGDHCNLRILHYPKVFLEEQPEANNEPIVRGARHTDFGTLTLLTQDLVGGLRVQLSDGSWELVPPVPGSIVVNVGDMLQRWTNDELRATPHQVVNLPQHGNKVPERYSIAFFCNANKDVTLECLEQVSKEIAKYPPINALEYLTQRLTETISSN